MALQHAHNKLLHDKEKLTEEIMVFGLWQSEDQIRECLASIKSTSEKLRALKLQLDFRKKVLGQRGPKEVFYMSRQKRNFTVEEVIQNLLTLLQGVTCTSSFPPVSPYLASQESLV